MARQRTPVYLDFRVQCSVANVQGIQDSFYKGLSLFSWDKLSPDRETQLMCRALTTLIMDHKTWEQCPSGIILNQRIADTFDFDPDHIVLGDKELKGHTETFHYKEYFVLLKIEYHSRKVNLECNTVQQVFFPDLSDADGLVKVVNTLAKGNLCVVYSETNGTVVIEDPRART